jgi:hypothetical protein
MSERQFRRGFARAAFAASTVLGSLLFGVGLTAGVASAAPLTSPFGCHQNAWKVCFQIQGPPGTYVDQFYSTCENISANSQPVAIYIYNPSDNIIGASSPKTLGHGSVLSYTEPIDGNEPKGYYHAECWGGNYQEGYWVPTTFLESSPDYAVE